MPYDLVIPDFDIFKKEILKKILKDNLEQQYS